MRDILDNSPFSEGFGAADGGEAKDSYDKTINP